MRIAFAPGRVNLIGEHTDYNGYPVLPMAINRGIRIVFSPRTDDIVTIRNNDTQFNDHRFTLSECAKQYSRGDWGNYVKAAIRGCMEELVAEGMRPVGFDALYQGDLPIAAGLSSSSALVVATALAFLSSNAIAWNPLPLAELLARSERYTGTQGGGMDQAVSLLGTAGHAVKIDFFPLRIERIAIPEDWLFVVCNSLVPAPKSAEVQHIYNTRVLECKIAAILISHRLGRFIHDATALRLAEVDPGRLGLHAGEFARKIWDCLPPGAVSMDAVCDTVPDDIAALIRSEQDRIMPDAAHPDDRFHIFDRYRHVVSEAARVEQAVEQLRRNDVKRLGVLLDQSHESCRDLYGVSSTLLDEMIDHAKRHGAIGARLTGAGFGGCTVNLVRKGSEREFVQSMEQHFHEKLAGASSYKPEDRIFIAEPSDGASVTMIADSTFGSNA